MTRRNALPPLSPAQQEIMEIIWARDEVTASGLRAELAKRRSISRNTVRTMLERMEEKGWLTHRVEGRIFYYSAAQPRRATIGQKVTHFVDELCGGSPEALVTALIDFRGLNDGELRRIRVLLDEAKAKKRRAGGK
jgi:predicted transcriptional regulator